MVTFHANIYGPLDRAMVILQLCCKYQMEGALPTNHCCCQKTSYCYCPFKISAAHCLVLLQSMRVTDRQNYDSKDRTSMAARAVKTASETFLRVERSTGKLLRYLVNELVGLNEVDAKLA